MCLSPVEVERTSQLHGMAIGSLRTPFKKHVAFFKIGASFLQCAHQDMKNSTRTTSDLLPQGIAKAVAPPGNNFFKVQVSASSRSKQPMPPGIRHL
jgi:hypothetical protein